MSLALLSAASIAGSGEQKPLPPITGGDAGPSSAKGGTVAFGAPFAVGTGASASGSTSAGASPAAGGSTGLLLLAAAALVLVLAWSARR